MYSPNQVVVFRSIHLTLIDFLTFLLNFVYSIASVLPMHCLLLPIHEINLIINLNLQLSRDGMGDVCPVLIA